MRTPLVVLTIAGSDSGGAAGIAADLTTFAALGAHGTCAVTAVTAQDTLGVRRIHPVPAAAVRDQLLAVLDDLPVAAVKLGMLGSLRTATVVADVLAGRGLPVVVDPVLRATTGTSFADPELLDGYRDLILPLATVVTPNRSEAARLSRSSTSADTADLATAVRRFGPAVVITGGDPGGETCVDLVLDADGLTGLEHRTVATRNDHGTGCTFAAALAVRLGGGEELRPAVRFAQAFVATALHRSRDWDLGRGRGPIAHTLLDPNRPVHPTAVPTPRES